MNLWTRFHKLVEPAPSSIVTVIRVNPDGSSLVTTAGGGTMRVLGNGVAAGNKAFVQNKRIIGEAPNLPYYELEA